MRKFVNDIILTNNKESWRQQGICSQTDPDIWFPGAGQTAQARLAIELCSQCPVRIECLEAALTSEDEEGGIWGGTTMKERKEMRETLARRQEVLAS